MACINYKSGTTWKTGKAAHYKAGNTWQKAKKIWYKSGTTWKSCSSEPPQPLSVIGLRSTALNFMSLTVELTFNTSVKIVVNPLISNPNYPSIVSNNNAQIWIYDKWFSLGVSQWSGFVPAKSNVVYIEIAGGWQDPYRSWILSHPHMNIRILDNAFTANGIDFIKNYNSLYIKPG